MLFIPLFTGFYTSQVVNDGFLNHQHYNEKVMSNWLFVGRDCFRTHQQKGVLKKLEELTNDKLYLSCIWKACVISTLKKTPCKLQGVLNLNLMDTAVVSFPKKMQKERNVTVEWFWQLFHGLFVAFVLPEPRQELHKSAIFWWYVLYTLSYYLAD